MTTAADIVSMALDLIANQVSVTGVNPTFDGTPAGNAAGVLYTPTVNLMLRILNPAFAHAYVTLTLNDPAPDPWAHQFTYPADCVKVRQLFPAGANVNDPQPVRWSVIFGNPVQTIVSNLSAARMSYTTNAATETEWDSSFKWAVAYRLSGPLAMALAGRPDFAKELLDEANQYAGIAAQTDDF